MQYALWAPLTAFAAALWIIWWLARSRYASIAVDHPGPRSLHDSPMPRLGGLGLHAGVLLAVFVIRPDLPPAIWAGFGLLLAVSWLEDARGVGVVWRFAAHLIAAGFFAYSAVPGAHGALVAAVATLAIAWMTNLYNFMDGSDGLAGGAAVIGFTFYGIAAWFGGSMEFALVNFSIAAAAGAFLCFNYPPARVFMGDAGAVPLGYLAGAMGAIGWVQNDWRWWFAPLVFSPLIADTSVTLARRLFRLERVWEAHHDHYYQRQIRLGWSHEKTALAEYALMLASGLLALALLPVAPPLQLLVLAGAAAGYLALAAVLERHWRASGRERAP
ncbi:MAG: glycosyltransferase family 4 protein [Betaproteobacteria bacterium]|nr:glycosyltransferase family 4 protein [Betaproteobacteria bacterium]